MIINRTARYLFVEPPFTGSTAVAGELVEHYGGESIIWKHAKYSDFRAQFGREAGDYFVFASIRNPLDQAVSEFVKLRNNHKGNFTNPAKFLRNGGYIPDETLAEFAWVQETDADFPAYFRKYKQGIFHNWYLIGHRNFDFIINFERLIDDFDEVLRRIGLDPVRPLPHVNPTEGKTHFAEYFTPDVRAQAFRSHGPFMKQWGFAFPEAWGPPRVPLSSRLRYALLDRGVELVSRHVSLDSSSGFVQRVKRLSQSTSK